MIQSEDSTHPWKYFCVQVGLQKAIETWYYLSIFFFDFYIWPSHLSSKKVENNSIWFNDWCTEENLVNNKDNRVLMS